MPFPVTGQAIALRSIYTGRSSRVLVVRVLKNALVVADPEWAGGVMKMTRRRLNDGTGGVYFHNAHGGYDTGVFYPDQR